MRLATLRLAADRLRRGVLAAGAFVMVVAAAAFFAHLPPDRGAATGNERAAPSVADVQAAYDRAALSADGLHDGDIRIVGVDCRPGTGMRFSCQVGFVKSEFDPTRVFLDTALVERTPKGWTLARGLCRRLI